MLLQIVFLLFNKSVVGFYKNIMVPMPILFLHDYSLANGYPDISGF
jgi:hypothetical protein